MPRPQILLEFPEDEFDLQTEWKEVVAPVRSNSASFSLGNSEDAITVEVPWNKIRSFIRQVCGYSVADVGSPYKLGRPEVPIRHPRFPWMWADSVSVQAWNPLGDVNPNYDQYATADEWWKVQTKWPGIDSFTYGNYGEPYLSPPFEVNYKQAYATVRFKEFPAPVFRDDDPTWTSSSKEYQRFVALVQATPKNEIVSAAGGTEGTALWWADSSAAIVGPPIIAVGPTAGGSAAGGKEFKGSVYTFKQQVGFSVLWKQVEESYIIDDSLDNYMIMPVPARLMAHLGTVNSATFCGQPPGTLLFSGLGLKRFQQPLPTDSDFGLFAYDVTLQFDYFKPKRPATVIKSLGPTGGSPADKQGWHCFPFGPNGYWYAATRGSTTTQGTYSGETLIRETAFEDMFLSVQVAAGAYP